jgi:hypothetical protein
MAENENRSLAGEKATIEVSKDNRFSITFGPDVHLIWASGGQAPEKSPAVLHPEIKGHLETDKDYSHIQDAELILDDQRVFKISFIGPKYFTAHVAINSRNSVYPS